MCLAVFGWLFLDSFWRFFRGFCLKVFFPRCWGLKQVFRCFIFSQGYWRGV